MGLQAIETASLKDKENPAFLVNQDIGGHDRGPSGRGPRRFVSKAWYGR